MTRKIITYSALILLGLLILVCAYHWKQDIPLEQLKKKYAPEPSRFIAVQGMEVHYRDEGNPQDTTPLVLLHGTGASLHTWEPCVRLLGTQYRIITLDLPAYGLTGPNPDGNYSPAFYVDFIAEFLSKIGIQQCVIGGNSLGGGIAWQYAYRYPEKVAKLILIDAAGYPMNPESTPIAFKLARVPVLKHLLKYVSPRPLAVKSVQNVYINQDKVTDALVDRYYELFLREGNRQAFIDRMAYFQYPDQSASIQQIRIPALILWGEQDRLIPVENAYRFQADLPLDTLVVLQQVGHLPMEEDPTSTAAVIRAFLSRQQ